MSVGVGLNKNTDKVKEIVDIYFAEKNVKIEEYDDSRRIFYIDEVKRKALNRRDFYDITTSMILDIILNIYSKDMIEKQINSIPNSFKVWEKKKVAEISEEILLDRDRFIVEKEYIYNKIKDYIRETPFIWIDGFVQFRLRKFNFFIDLVIEKGIKEFNAEKEYEEFIKVLQYFVDIQEPKHSLVNLIFEDRDYKLYDEMNNLIDRDFFKEIIEEIGSEDISRDDLLVSSLIVIAPKKLKIHLGERHKNKDVIRIIANVFQDRVYFCYGCEQCNKSIKMKRDKRY